MKSLFDDLEPRDLSRLDEEREPVWVARVVFTDGLDGVFDYRIPPALVDPLTPGMRVVVPLGKGNRPVTAYCLEVQTRPAADSLKLKEVRQVLDATRLVSEKMLALARWIASRYLCPLGQVLEAVVPAGVRDKAGTRLTQAWKTRADLDAQLTKIEKLRLRKGVELLTPKQKYILDILKNSPEPMTMSELARAAKCSLARRLWKRPGLYNQAFPARSRLRRLREPGRDRPRVLPVSSAVSRRPFPARPEAFHA